MFANLVIYMSQYICKIHSSRVQIRGPLLKSFFLDMAVQNYPIEIPHEVHHG